ncbi:glycosyltransferase family 2 protein [Pseudobutyrivibrio ruminis]|uniref:glycosyltransferase family 2 protein n=1 Tax=Pseudobutyrivibrio ruminis TaxID=46206 RepID=UPI000429FBC0|nr:glycosyltransferase family A protein [Pseudobutyrivibrio ruminis]
MKFSIIVPIYNVQDYLEKCLDTIVNQTFDDYEIILVNDGSTDSSEAICRNYMKTCNREYQIINQENAGLSAARNTGLAVAKGDWIVFVDSDDYVSLELLECLNKAMAKADADLYSYNHSRVDQCGKRISKKLYAVENNVISFASDEDRNNYICEEFLNYSLGWEAWGMIYKRSIIADNKLMFQNTAEVFAEDLCFSLQYMMHVQKIYVLCDLLYNYRIRSGSLLETAASESILPRIYRLAEFLYSKGNLNKALKKNFSQVYQLLVDFHIKYNLVNTSAASIDEQLKELEKTTKYHKRWYKNNDR